MTYSRSEMELNGAVHQVLQGPRYPQKEFVHDGATFAELYEMAASLRNYFQNGADTPYACLCTHDKTVVSAALLASLAGGPVLVLPYAFSTQVLSELRQLIDYRHVVTDRTLPVPEGIGCVIPRKGEASWPTFEGLSPKEPEHDWVRLFTGGSTGTPKMWTKTVRNLLAETMSIISYYEVTEQDRLVATVSPIHIYGLLYSILAPLFTSASVAASTPSFPGEIETAVAKSDASIFISVPAHYRALNGHPLKAAGLRLAFSSAGMLAEADAEAFSRETGVGIAEIYGSTETGGIASRVRAQEESDFKAYDSIDVRIEEERLKVKSDYLSPELERTVDGYFEVADRVTSTEGGRFALLGRADGVVKVGGRRVDLEAVKELIKRMAGVRDAVVISLPVDTGRENQIVAVVEGGLEHAVLHKALASHIEPFARPRSIKIVERMPMTAAGKYDRKEIENLFSP